MLLSLRDDPQAKPITAYVCQKPRRRAEHQRREVWQFRGITIGESDVRLWTETTYGDMFYFEYHGKWYRTAFDLYTYSGPVVLDDVTKSREPF